MTSTLRSIDCSNSSFGQLRLPDECGLEFHVCNLLSVSRCMLASVDLARTRWSSINFGRSWAVLRTILVSTFVDNFYDAFFQHGLVRNVGSDAVCQNSFLRRGQVNSALRILLRFFNEFHSSPSSVSRSLYLLLLRLHRCSFSSFTNSDSAVEYWSRARSTW